MKDPVDPIIDLLNGTKRPRVDEDAYVYSLLERLKEDLTDALTEPRIWEECVMAAKDKVNSIELWLKGEI